MTMHGNITLPDFQIISPTNAQSYLNAARQLYAGMEALSLQPSKTGVACSFLAAQTLECGLKSYLSNNGVAENKLKEKEIRHDLEKLWVQAVQHGLDVSSQPPQWCVILKGVSINPPKILPTN